jgi:lysozyme
MPSKKKKSYRFVKLFIFLMAMMAMGAIAYIGIVWWQSRKLEFVRYEEFGIAIPAKYSIHGIDVSRYQQIISWESVKEMQVENIKLTFAFIKATEGNGNVDPFFKRNWRKAKNAGMTRGAYHFFICSKDGKKQAQNYINRVTLESGDLPPVLDVEQTHGTSASDIQKRVKDWLVTMEEYYGTKPIIYTNIYFYEQYLQGHFDDYPLWVAHYLESHQPRIKRDWAFWQHSEQGRVNGIRSKVDFNVFNGDSVTFQSYLLP